MVVGNILCCGLWLRTAFVAWQAGVVRLLLPREGAFVCSSSTLVQLTDYLRPRSAAQVCFQTWFWSWPGWSGSRCVTQTRSVTIPGQDSFQQAVRQDMFDSGQISSDIISTVFILWSVPWVHAEWTSIDYIPPNKNKKYKKLTWIDHHFNRMMLTKHVIYYCQYDALPRSKNRMISTMSSAELKQEKHPS